jgi:hypothetical protein
VFSVGMAEDLPPIIRERLRLDEPVCSLWVESMMIHLARRMEPGNAKWWWYRRHIALKGRAPAYVLPDGWTPACAEACLLEAYAIRG